MSSKPSCFKTYSFAVGAFIGIMVIAVLLGRALEWYYKAELSGWVQAVGAIAAIVAGFAVAADQQQSQQVAAANDLNEFTRATHMLAHAALQTVSERLDTASTPRHDKKAYALQGDRTTEMVRAMSDTVRIPSEILPYFIRLRSHVYAINSRISEIYEDEKLGCKVERDAKVAERPGLLKSSVRVYDASIELFLQLQEAIAERFPLAKLQIKTGPSLEAYPRIEI
ncbi:hypothetical protein WGT02_28170 (plasmid) [Rhizobium sp. T1470]|nr:hypothetical protein [Rhizobium sp. T1473]MCA0805205.1 hypothetical protein [Rhizobium sp. T1473]